MADAGMNAYWSVDIPGLTALQAAWLKSVVDNSPHQLHAITVNPESFLTLHLDADSAEVIREALRSRQDNREVAGIIETIDEWLNHVYMNGKG